MNTFQNEPSCSHELSLLWNKDPSMLTKDEFSKSGELLFHGTSQDFLYDQSLACPGDNLNWYLMGRGFYCTDSRKEATERYAKKWVVKEFLPFNAKMLDLRECNNFLPKAVIEAYFSISKKIPSKWLLKKWAIIKWWRQRQWLSFLEFLYKNHNHQINLKELLKTGDCSYFDYQKYWSHILKRYHSVWWGIISAWPEIDILWDTLSSIWIDWIICYERWHILDEFKWPEDEIKPDSSYYIFYNPSVIWTYENWQIKDTTRKWVAKVLNK